MLTSSLLLVALATGADPQNTPIEWNQWRGPRRDGTVAATPAWPGRLTDANFRPLWSAKDLGPSYSGPLILADRIITTETVSKKGDRVVSYDRATGRKQWDFQWDGVMTVPFFAAKNGSWIRSTPAADATTVYVAGMTDILVALERTTGKLLWKLDFAKELKAPVEDFGCVCSPLVDDSGVYLQAGQAFYKVDKSNGKIIWTCLKDTGGMMSSGSFSSPVFATIAGRDQIVVQTRTTMAGVDRSSGSVLWSRPIPHFRGMNILTPIPAGPETLFTSSYQNGSYLIRVGRKDDTLAADEAWKLKFDGYMSTPVVVDGHAYLLGRDRRLACINLAKGTETWRTEERFGEYWSLVAQGRSILALDNRGLLLLFDADPKEFRLRDKRDLPIKDTWAHLAVAGSDVVIRDLSTLTAYRWADPAGK